MSFQISSAAFTKNVLDLSNTSEMYGMILEFSELKFKVLSPQTTPFSNYSLFDPLIIFVTLYLYYTIQSLYLDQGVFRGNQLNEHPCL